MFMDRIPLPAFDMISGDQTQNFYQDQTSGFYPLSHFADPHFKNAIKAMSRTPVNYSLLLSMKQ